MKIRAATLLVVSACASAAPSAKDAVGPSAPSRPAVSIPAGRFEIGSTAAEPGHDDDEGPPLPVELGAFSLDARPVTTAELQARAAAILQREPAAKLWTEAETPAAWEGKCNLGSDRADHPANCADWLAAATFCRLEGADLPTEAELEIAARAGSTAAFWWGDVYEEARAITSVACGKRGCRGATAPVVTAGPRCNGWGVCDAVGNVWHWTASEYAPKPGPPAITPAAAPKKPVLKGASWLNEKPALFRAAQRGLRYPKFGLTEIGFRCVRRGGRSPASSGQ